MIDRICYCSTPFPEKIDALRAYFASKAVQNHPAVSNSAFEFWNALQMVGFDCWLQPRNNLLLHCLEGKSLRKVFEKLREQINCGNNFAIQLHSFCLDIFGEDYKDPLAEPQIECLLDITLPRTGAKIVKKCFAYPLLPHKEEEHRAFRRESMSKMKSRHEASMKAFGVAHLSSWLQNRSSGKFIICYSEHQTDPEQKLKLGNSSPEWMEIAKILMDQTGLNIEELTPEIEKLTMVENEKL